MLIFVAGLSYNSYNLSRLRKYICEYGFDPQGNVLMHLGCMGACFDVGADFMTTCHRSAVRFANTKTEKISKAEFERRGLAEEDTIRPPESDGSHKEFMAQLKDLNHLTHYCLR